MVLIVSELGDDSTNGVIDWISFYGGAFYRINRDLFLIGNDENINFEFDSEVAKLSSFTIDGSEIDLDDIKSVWFRRSHLPSMEESFSEIGDKDLMDKVNRNIYNEYFILSRFLFARFQSGKKVLGNFQENRLNKLEILNQAKNHGIDIPATLISNKKSKVQDFLIDKGKIVTKAISEVFDIELKSETGTKRYLNYTEEVTMDSLLGWPDDFFYSLFQEKLDKDFEIRIFYLNGDLFPMAIFSQLEEQTSVDFRKYSNNRRVPYKLPIEIEQKLNTLMNSLKLNCGSIDLVKTKEGRYVFLEINPTGQYGMTSYPCNYHIDEKIAQFLIT